MRTDRTHSFFSGTGTTNDCDGNSNLKSLLNILTTFALNHRVKYCQGMSDLASPLLYAMRGDESHTYVSFCALMSRMADNFAMDGISMSRKFQHLVRLLMYYDPEFYCYLRQHGAHELLFCYRWMLLELKREFAFDDALHMLEVMWSSIPPKYTEDLAMFDLDSVYKPGTVLKCSTGSLADSVVTTTGKNFSVGSFSTIASTLMNAASFDRDTLCGSSFEGSPSGRLFDTSCQSTISKGKRGGQSPRQTSNKLATDEDLNASSGRGSLSTYSSVGTTSTNSVSQAIDVPAQQPRKPVRKIRFLPKILSNDDSREIDSPEEEEFFRSKQLMYSLPPKFIDKQFSVDFDDEGKRGSGMNRSMGTPTRFAGSFEGARLQRMTSMSSSNGGSFDRDDYNRRVRSFDGCDDGLRSRNGSLGSLSPKRRLRLQSRLAESRSQTGGSGSKLLVRQRNALEEDHVLLSEKFSLSVDGENGQEYLVHCNGEYSDDYATKEWSIPRGLARSHSWDSLTGSNDLNSASASRQNSRDYDDQAPFWANSTDVFNNSLNRSASSSCSSLVILSSNGTEAGSTCSARHRVTLPSPTDLGSSNAFMMFLCLTMLLQHRDTIMSRGYDYNEIAMYFDGLVRKHKVKTVLESGRHLFHSYLSHWQRSSMEQEDPLNAQGFYMNGSAFLAEETLHEQTRCGL